MDDLVRPMNKDEFLRKYVDTHEELAASDLLGGKGLKVPETQSK